jgi:rhodanese-related sulfurtransferase
MAVGTVEAQINPTECYRRMQAGDDVLVLDVRAPGEFAAYHVEAAENIPLGRLTPEAVSNACDGDKGKALYIMCKAGVRARKARGVLDAAGFDNALVVEGGIDGWTRAGQPVLHGTGGMSIERQVRIVAGFLIAAGVALGIWVNPYFFILPAFVGCGLVFAGITDFCGMGIIMAKLPWNK